MQTNNTGQRLLKYSHTLHLLHFGLTMAQLGLLFCSYMETLDPAIYHDRLHLFNPPPKAQEEREKLLGWA